MKEKDIYLEYVRERKMIRRITFIRKIVGYSFLGVFLFFLFSVSYTANPAIVILNYLALLTSFSGLIFFKVFEIPRCILEIKSKRDDAEIFQLTEFHRSKIIETTASEMNLNLTDLLESNVKADKIIELFGLEKRLPWRRIGAIYLAVYLLLVISFCSYLVLDYLETGFLRP